MKATRRTIQFGFVALTLVAVFVVGGNAERWCPFGGVEAIYSYIQEGNLVCSLGVSNFYILAGVLLATLLLRRVFCGYVCPVGALSEWIQAGAKRLGIKPARVPAAADRVLSLLKYAVLAVILFITWRAGELLFRGFDPCYALISRHGEDITLWSYVVAGGIVALSIFLTVPFCRWLCPLAAVLNPFSRFGLLRVTRDPETCVDCGKCAKVCPMAIPVDERVQVKEARCTACLDCVASCPEQENGALAWTAAGTPAASAGVPAAGAQRRGLPQAVLVGVLFLCLGASVAASYVFPLPSFVKTRGTPPSETAVVELEVEGIGCRGNATLFCYFLERDDELAVEGFLKVEAWPGPGLAKAHITYDPALTDEEWIKQAATEPYFDELGDFWRTPPFTITGYDPLGLGGLE